MWAELPGMVLP